MCCFPPARTPGGIEMTKRDARERILLVDDSPDTLEVLERNLAHHGYGVIAVTGGREAMKRLEAERFDLVVTDMRMPEMSGMDLVRYVREVLPDTEVMMITGYATIESAVEAVKTGAEEHLAKPFTDEELLEAVGRTLAKLHARRAARLPGARFGLVGESASMRRTFAAMERATRETGPVLLLGEGGTGRGVAARSIARTRGVEAPLRMVDGRLWDDAMGSSGGLSGAFYVRGLEWLGPDGQTRLVRAVLSSGSGGPQLFLAGGPELPVLVEAGAFRADLYASLVPVTVPMPPLRERGDDVALLARHFAGDLARRCGRAEPAYTPAALEALGEYAWPGNVEELKAAVLSAYCRAAGESIDWKDWPTPVRAAAAGRWSERTLAEAEADHILKVLARTGGNKSRTAEVLGVDRKTLREKLRLLGRERDGEEA
jgi:two-component system, NtrC family, response regulator HydG